MRLGNEDVIFTDHALQRATQMGVEGPEITAAILRPDKRRASRKYEGADLFDHGRITLATRMDEGKRIVLTVLWRTADGWAQDPTPDRTPRPPFERAGTR